MADVFEEIDEAMRQEKMVALWHEYKSALITFLVFLVIGTGAVSAYKSWNYKTKTSQTDVVLNVLDDDSNIDGISAASDLRPGLRGITLLTTAEEKLQNGKKDEALALYQQISKDRQVPSDLRELATLMRVRLTSAKAEAGTQLDHMMADLQAIWRNDKSPWAAHARLEAAVLSANFKQDFPAAIGHLKTIADDGAKAPQSIRNRAAALTHVYTLKSETPAPAAAPKEAKGEG